MRDIRLGNINEKRKNHHVDGGLASFDLKITSPCYNTLLDVNAVLSRAVSTLSQARPSAPTLLVDVISVHDF